MTAEPIAVSAQTTLEAAAILMIEHQIHHLPVVEGERQVGMVGMRDVVHSVSSEFPRGMRARPVSLESTKGTEPAP
jgi:CBS domain-containing protein